MGQEIAPNSLRAVRSTETTFPRERYVSPAVFEEETRQIFAKQWTFAGHISQIPNVGDFFSHNFAGENLLIVRESTESVRAHYNVCRHRGSQLSKSDKGNVRNFVCPYHQWSYGLDGSLRRAPMMADKDCIDYEKLSLFPAAVEVWAGLIFVNLTSNPTESLTELLGTPSDELKKLQPENMKEIFREALPVKGNWKTLLENYLECYHCAGSHPELGIAFDIQSSYGQTAGWGGSCFLGGEPLRKGFTTVSMNGELVSKPLGIYADKKELPVEITDGVGLLPVLSRVIFHIDHAIIHTMNPISESEVEWTSRWYVHSDAIEGVDYEIDKVIEVWRATNAEDKELCERNYKGVLSRKFQPGPLNPLAEGAVRPALDLIDSLMAAV
ncbi:aromatic ring-hydroxylating oxygenase subunit alpha [Agrobacterium sp. MCAB5]|uniref:aromatic ring-hydroxylating oxygenase subunit alpha n=1 Tax=Agrobacterium sp. MCAB5 TaxID=3233042 RepID=UPI003F8E9016